MAEITVLYTPSTNSDEIKAREIQPRKMGVPDGTGHKQQELDSRCDPRNEEATSENGDSRNRGGAIWDVGQTWAKVDSGSTSTHSQLYIQDLFKLARFSFFTIPWGIFRKPTNHRTTHLGSLQLSEWQSWEKSPHHQYSWGVYLGVHPISKWLISHI